MMDSSRSEGKSFPFLCKFSMPDQLEVESYEFMAHLSSQGLHGVPWSAVPQCFLRDENQSPLAEDQEGIFSI